MRVKDAVGRFGEQLAAERLEAAGLILLERNWRGAAGELDIVARQDAVLVFVEVKTRSTLAYGAPAEAVDARKAARIRLLAVEWMAVWRAARPAFWSSVRFDVVSVVRRGPAPAGRRRSLMVEHVIGAF